LEQGELAEGTAFASKPFFEAGCAIAVVAGPVLGTVQIATSTARVRVLNFHEVEILLPVRALFLQRRGAIADLDPLHGSILELPRLRHVSKVFIPRDRSSAERAVLDRAVERLFLARLHFGGDEISHD